MKQIAKNPEGAKEKFGIDVKVNKALEKLKGKDLFPKKTEKINELISKLDLK